MRFSKFIDKKNSQARKELSVIRDILEEGDLKVEDFLKDESPYLYLHNPDRNLDFDGVRIYKVGSNLAYRIQRESKTAPYGTSYSLNIEEVFGDLISEMDEEKAAKKIKKALLEEFKNFFKQSLEAQEELMTKSNDPQNKIVIKGGSGDLSNSM